MKYSSRKADGSISIEFTIVTVFLMIPIWYTFMGGSGIWNDADRDPNLGNVSVGPAPAQVTPGLVQVLDTRQRDFAHALNQP